MRTIVLSLSMGLMLIGCTSPEPPAARPSPVVKVYHGVEVVDAYQWLEDWSDQQVRSWSDRQNDYARSVLDELPAVDHLHKRISGILNAVSSRYYGLSWYSGALFAIKDQPPLEQPLLVVMPSADEPDLERIVVDPNQLDPEGTTTIDWFVPSPDGKLVAVSLSRGGSEVGDLYLYEVGTGREVGEMIPHVSGGTAGGDLAWVADGSGFFYTRYPQQGERPPEDMNFYQQVWFHRMGTTVESDRYEIGREFPRVAEILLEINHDSGHLLLTVQDGDSGRFAHYLRTPDGQWQRVATYDDRIVQALFGPDNALFLLSRQGAPRGQVLRLSLETLSLDRAETLVPESDQAIVSNFYLQQSNSHLMVVTPTRIYLIYQLGGPSEIRVFDHQGRPQPGPAMPPVSSVGQIVPLRGDDILYETQSYLEPAAWYRFSPQDGITRRSALVTESPVDYTDCEVVREHATSKDGTRVPVNIIRPRDLELDGSHPVFLTGYGGFGFSNEPYFSSLRRVWIEQGGVYAVANLRGGGEFGEAWHRAGTLTKKQNVFDDFAAVMQYLIDAGYTSPDKLAIVGGSNGGLLMGAMITQHPDLFKVTVSFVGIYDMLRVELSPNGAFNIPEYGTVKDPEQFKAMVAYSPYHNVKDGTTYPAILFMTGANDPRVDPMQSRKMTARLQAATSSDAPILLRTSSTTGHSSGTPLSERVKEYVDEFAFLFHALGIEVQPVE